MVTSRKHRPVWIIVAQTLYDVEILGVCRRKRDALEWIKVEQENYRASGSLAEVRAEKWEVE